MIVDEMIDFFNAAVSTSALVSQTLLTHLIQSPESLKKVREEFKSIYEKQTMNFSLLTTEKDEMLNKIVNLNSVYEMEYLNCVLLETLRF